MVTTPRAGLLLLSLLAAAAQAQDRVIAEFEAEDYGAWKVEGNAFGKKPARGTLPGQMPVEGFAGQGLVNSFAGGDDAKGLLISTPFPIERKYITFLIGGGGWPGETSMELLVDGRAVRTAHGPNTAPGGSERLQPMAWDVSEFVGREATLQIVDQRTGGWGHINVDQIVQTDDTKGAPLSTTRPVAIRRDATRELTAEKRLLHFPVKNGAPKRQVEVLVDGRAERHFEIELADGEPEWWAPLEIGQWRGKEIAVRVDRLPEESSALKALEQSDTLKGGAELYREPRRGQLHFSPRRGWLNDPNGMVFAHGEYHLYFQYNPYGWAWGNMHWGHAVSRDLVRWEELPIALYPHSKGDAVFSGSAVVDKENTSGWRAGDNGLLVAAYTSTGRGECIVYSNDRGRTWTEYEGNPVIRHQGRDPRLLWHEPTQQWVMAVYSEDTSKTAKEEVQGIDFYTSPDLKKWTRQSRVTGYYECPDLFELPVEGSPSDRKWVLTGANSDYQVGSFDGKVFTPETAILKGHRGRGFYAAQTFTNEPQGRVVQMGWFQTETRGMPFNQSMSLPLTLSLRPTAEGPRVAWAPVDELRRLRVRSHTPEVRTMRPETANPLAGIEGECLEIRAKFSPGSAAKVTFNVRGVPIIYDAAQQEVVVNGHRAPAPLREGSQEITVYVDRIGLEVFASDGLCFVPMPLNIASDQRTLELRVEQDAVEFGTVEVHELGSIWR